MSVTQARHDLLGIVSGVGWGVKASEKSQPEVREKLNEEVGSLNQLIKAHATKKKRVQDTIMG